MAALTRFKNPILWQETTHQERGTRRWAARWRGVGALALFFILLFAPVTLTQVSSPTRETALLAIWLVHAATGIYAIIAGANAISREHVGQTWDALVLTGIGARQILFGKWRAALYRSRGWLLALGVIRLAMLPVFVLAALNRYAWFGYYSYSSSRMYGSTSSTDMDWLPWAALLSVSMTLVLTVLEVMACTALGLAASALTRRGVLATILALTVRFVPVALFAAFTRYELGPSSYLWWRFTPLALADGGTSPLYQLVLPIFSWTRGRHAEALPGLALAVGLLLGYLIVSLFAAWLAIRSSGALPKAAQS